MGNESTFDKFEDETRNGLIESIQGDNWDAKKLQHVLKTGFGISLTIEKISLIIEATKLQIQSNFSKKFFEKMDSNNDGKVSRNDLKKGMKLTMKQFNEKQVDVLIKKIDLDGNGTLEYEEVICLLFVGNCYFVEKGKNIGCVSDDLQIRSQFQEAIDSKSQTIDKEKFRIALMRLGHIKSTKEVELAFQTFDKQKFQIKALFKMFDKNNDGTLDLQELFDGYSQLGMSITKKEMERIFQRLDVNDDKKMQWIEFKIFMLITLVSNS